MDDKVIGMPKHGPLPCGIQPVKTAMVGCGAISDIFFKNFTEKFDIIDLVKCCSKGGASAEAKARQYGLQKSTLEEILADPEIELVVNATPASQHYDIIHAALEAGKHVYTEKIITPDYRKTRELIEFAEEKGLFFGSEPDHFMGSAWQNAREIVDAGQIGQVTGALISVGQNYSAIAERLRFVNEPGGGIAYDFGIYLITQLVALLGPAAEVCGIMDTQFPERTYQEIKYPTYGKPYHYANEDIASASIRMCSGAVVSVLFCGNSILETPSQFMVMGTKGVMTLPLGATFSGDVKLYRPGAFEPMTMLPYHGFDQDSRGVGAADLAWALRTGRKQIRADAKLGLHCQEIIQGIEESSRTRQFYQMTTTCERPPVLPAGYRGVPGFVFSEESSLAVPIHE